MAARVLVADDSIVAREVLSSILIEAGFDVVGTASSGSVVVAKIPLMQPDVVTMDLDMPDMDGLEALSEIRRRFPDVHVLMVSAHTRRGALTTMEALFRGAADYVTKPAGAASADEARRELAAQLIPKLRALVAPRTTTRPPRREPTRSSPSGRPAAIGIAASTGGPMALAELLRELPADLHVPVLVVQHMPAMFTEHLARRLDSQCRIAVLEASEGARPLPGTVWIAPGDRHLEVHRTGGGHRISVTSAPPVNGCRPSADILFQSMVECWDDRVLAAVLTGMGRDGLRGSEVICAAGGRVFAQDRISSTVWGMPSEIVGAGLADLQASPAKLAREIVRRVATSAS